MFRSTIAAMAVMAVGASRVPAQDWAAKMFTDTSHNFGTVAKDAKTEFRFTFKNIYRDPVHITGVRTSCGCTSPTVLRDTVPSLETGEILAHFNTDRFTGQRGATLTVTVDRPQHAEVRLRVDGFIRSDVMVRPGSVNFGSITQGTVLEQTVSVDYTGASRDWKITGVRSNSPYFEAKLLNPSTNTPRGSYRVFIKLKEGAPPGYVQDAVTVTTNDPTTPQLPIGVEGRILPELSVSPQTLVLGTVPMGQKITKQIVVQAKRPFSIVGIKCDDPSFEFKLPTTSEPKNWHVIPITFDARDAGKLVRSIHIETDLGRSAETDLPVHVEVLALANK